MATAGLSRVKKAVAASPVFDVEQARLACARFIESDTDPDTTDPLYSTWLKLNEYEERQAASVANYKATLGADKGVSAQDASKLFQIGLLISSEEDYLTVHTREAHRLFIGRGADPEGNKNRILGAKNVGTALRQLWQASKDDHPYADWALLTLEQAIEEQSNGIKTEGEVLKKHLSELAEKGLHLSVLKSRQPLNISLGFRSPYGYMLAQLVMEFDYFVRVAKTLGSRNILSADEARLVIHKQLKALRGLFDRANRFQSLLVRPAFLQLKRADFSATAPLSVRKRVADLASVWPGLPDPILAGELLPRHAHRIAASTVATVPHEAETEESVLI